MTHENAGRTAGCATFDATLPDYLAERCTDREADAVEAHAAACARCEAMLDGATQVAVTSFAPPIPERVRASTLATIAAMPPHTAGRLTAAFRSAPRWRLGAGLALMAAAAAIVIVARPADYGVRRPPNQLEVAAPAAQLYGRNAAMQRAAQLASDRARGEFESLDAAAQELERALQVDPGDAGLRDYLSAVRARHSELMHRVKEATS